MEPLCAFVNRRLVIHTYMQRIFSLGKFLEKNEVYLQKTNSRVGKLFVLKGKLFLSRKRSFNRSSIVECHRLRISFCSKVLRVYVYISKTDFLAKPFYRWAKLSHIKQVEYRSKCISTFGVLPCPFRTHYKTVRAMNLKQRIAVHREQILHCLRRLQRRRPPRVVQWSVHPRPLLPSLLLTAPPSPWMTVLVSRY